ncbi:hypothetical protein BVG19_g55 [[Candida] boidinii]|nr:hypothetical protein BVG19_g55 [[Candida] boidinii]OWB53407.1 hypothetical protein B5S27_g5003 [[Candida] boidinii]OWB85740.1 hypothetical protein B5S33_g4411 [[Candida] boidinii]
MPQSDIIPAEEQHIYDELKEIRLNLSKLKRDHKTYLNSKDINQIYELVLLKTKELKIIRHEDEKAELHPIDFPNKVDILMDEIFQLLSLCFMTVGLTNSAPATYASLSTVQRLLEHLNESEIFTHQDLKPIKDRLDEINKIIHNDEEELKNEQEDQDEESRKNNNSFEELKLLEHKLDQAYKEYNFLEDKINTIPENIQKITNELISIKRSLFNALTSHSNDRSISNKQLEFFKKKLFDIEHNNDDLFDSNEDGKGLVKGLTDDCHYLIADLENDSDKVDPSLKPLYDQLDKLKSTLENLLVTRRWVLRTTDIFNYQRTLQEIDNKRVNGFFILEDGSKPLKGQTILLYLLRRCYAIIYKLLVSSEPVSEALQSLHNQLTTIRNCLMDLKRMDGISSLRELYPYQLKLASIDNLRKDGKFIVGGHIPEGQGTLNALLAECFDICHELKIEFYERQEDEEEDDEENENKDGENKDGSSNKKSSSKKIDTAAVVGSKAMNYDYNNLGNDSVHTTNSFNPIGSGYNTPTSTFGHNGLQSLPLSANDSMQNYNYSEDNLASYQNSIAGSEVSDFE